MSDQAELEAQVITDPTELEKFRDPTDPRELIEVEVFKNGSTCKHWRGWRFFGIKEGGEVR